MGDLTLAEMAERLGVRTNTLRGQIHRGKLSARRQGRDWVVAEEEFDRYQAVSWRRRPTSIGDLDRLLREVARVFIETAEWPTIRAIQRTLAQAGLDVDLESVALPRSLGSIDSTSDGRVRLSIRGLHRSAQAKCELRVLTAMIALGRARYLDPAIAAPEVTSADVAARGEPADVVRRVGLMLSFAPFVSAGGHTSAEGDEWAWFVDDRIRKLREPFSIGDYLTDIAAIDAGGVFHSVRVRSLSRAFGPVLRRSFELADRLASARSDDDYGDVGRRCREVLAESGRIAAQALGTGAGPADRAPKILIDIAISTWAPEQTAAIFRQFTREAWNLANEVTHRQHPDPIAADAAVRATLLIVSVLNGLALRAMPS